MNKLIYKIKDINQKEYNFEKNKKISLLLAIFLFSGIYGFLYEEIFYYFDLGYFTKRGITFGPWIPIYAFGGLAMILLLNKYKKNPLLIFILGTLITGIIEYLTGFILLKFFNLRLWDYNNEILNFGNINGFICLRSVLFFAISGLILIYILKPLLELILSKTNKLAIIINILSIIFIIDILVSLFI